MSSDNAIISNDTLNDTLNNQTETYLTHVPFTYCIPEVDGFVQDFLGSPSAEEDGGIISFQDINKSQLLLQGNNYSSFTFSTSPSKWYIYSLSQFGSPSFGPKYCGFEDFISNAGKTCSIKSADNIIKEIQDILSTCGIENPYDFAYVGSFSRPYLLQCAEANKVLLQNQIEEIPQLQQLYDYIYADGSYESGLEECYVVLGNLLINDVPVNSSFISHDDQFIYQPPFLFCIYSKSGLLYIHFDNIKAAPDQGMIVSKDQLVSCKDATAIMNDEVVNWENKGYAFESPTLQYIIQPTSDGLQLYLCWCQTGCKNDLMQTVCIDAVTGEMIF